MTPSPARAAGALLAYLRDTDEEQIVVVGNRGPGTRPAGPLPVGPGAIPNGVEMVELFTGRRVSVVAGALPLPTLPPGVTIWRSQS